MPVPYDIITFTNADGVAINFSNPPYQLNDHEGFGISEFEDTFVEPPGGHGAYWYDTRMSAKVVAIDFTVMEEGVVERQNQRRNLVALLNPLLGPGIIRLEQVNGVIRELVCKLSESFDMPTSGFLGSGAMQYTMNFKSHGIPAFYDPTINAYVFSGATIPGTFSFPWSFPRVFAQSGFFGTVPFNNVGDIETPVHITLVGPALNPIFRNDTTGEQLATTGLTLAAGQTLEIDTDPNNLQFQIGGVDAWNYIDVAQFWMLARGTNNIVLDIGGTTSATNGSVTWYSRYIGQ
jgi:hypothetical protein